MSQAITDALRETRVRHVVALTTVAADRAGVPGPPAGLPEHERRLAGLRDPTCWSCGRPPTTSPRRRPSG
jgi:hypothetical protein